MEEFHISFMISDFASFLYGGSGPGLARPLSSQGNLNEYKCKLHPSKSNEECLELGTVRLYTLDPNKPSDQQRNLNGDITV